MQYRRLASQGDCDAGPLGFNVAPAVLVFVVLSARIPHRRFKCVSSNVCVHHVWGGAQKNVCITGAVILLLLRFGSLVHSWQWLGNPLPRLQSSMAQPSDAGRARSGNAVDCGWYGYASVTEPMTKRWGSCAVASGYYYPGERNVK